MYSTYNERKSAVAERFDKTLKSKIFKHMAAVSKNVYFDVLDDTFHRIIGMKPTDVMLNTMLTPIKKIPNLKLMIM